MPINDEDINDMNICFYYLLYFVKIKSIYYIYLKYN